MSLYLFLAIMFASMYAALAYSDHTRAEVQKVCLASHSVEECSKLNR